MIVKIPKILIERHFSDPANAKMYLALEQIKDAMGDSLKWADLVRNIKFQDLK